MIYIDWISPREHANFNICFFNALQLRKSKLYVFDDSLVQNDQESHLIYSSQNRFKRFFDVLSIAWRHRKQELFFLSYDPVLIIFLQLFASKIYCYEHNTTPEGKTYLKNFLWQKVFFWRIFRFAQFHAQARVLEKMGRKFAYLGSPLQVLKKFKLSKKANLYIAPSDRLTFDELLKVANLVSDDESIIIRKSHFSDQEIQGFEKVMPVLAQSYIDFEEALLTLKAIIIAIPSEVRGSGWYNEAIMRGIPLMITSPAMQKIFQETFPDYPYICVQEVKDMDQLTSLMNKCLEFDHEKYIQQHNFKFKTTFSEYVNGKMM